MRPEPRFSPDAQADVLSGARYYESERPGLGIAFLDEVEHAVSLIRDAPFLFTLVDDPVRRVLLRRLSFGLFYEPGERDAVLAVVDLRQDPETVRRAYGRGPA